MKYDARGRPYIEQSWNGLTDIPPKVEQLGELGDPGSGMWILVFDGDADEFTFEPAPT